MKTKFLLILMLCSGLVSAQDQASFNTLQVSMLAPLDITFTNAQELLQQKVIANALRVDIQVKQERTHVYAVVAFNGTAQNHPLSRALSLRLGTKTSETAVLPGSVVMLSPNPALLFMQPPGKGNTEHHSFFYDLLVNPLETMTPPGDHAFALTFTITAE